MLSDTFLFLKKYLTILLEICHSMDIIVLYSKRGSDKKCDFGEIPPYKMLPGNMEAYCRGQSHIIKVRSFARTRG